MKLRNNLIFLSFILFLSCSKVNIENENKTMMEGLKEKEISTENLRREKEGMLSLDECIDLALKNNSQIKLKEIEAKIAKIDKNISFGNFLPRISTNSLTPVVTFLPFRMSATILTLTSLDFLGLNVH